MRYYNGLKVAQQNSTIAEESAAASEELSAESARLEVLVAQFKLKNSGKSLSKNNV